MKSWRELGIDLKEAQDGTRASLDGEVLEKLSYSDWLRNLPVAQQNEAIGRARAQLYRTGQDRHPRLNHAPWLLVDLVELLERELDVYAAAGISA